MVPDPNTKQAQRLWPRWFIAGTKPVKVDLGPAGSGPLVDISGGGFRVQSLAPLRRGAEVPVRIEIPDHQGGLQCSGVVVWSKPNGAAGVRFAGLNDEQKAILQRWLAELEQAATAPAHASTQDEFTSVVSQIRGAQLNNADALNLIVRRAKELNAVSGVAIAIGTAESMVCMASVGEAPQVGATIPAVIGLTGECVFKRKMVHCEDSKNDPRVGRDSSFGSAVVLPLVVNNEVRGVVQAFSKRSYAFAVSSIDALEKLADAVVFVTYGIVTQRRLATAKSASVPASSTVGPRSVSSPSMTASWTAPTPSPATTNSTHTNEFVSSGSRPVPEPMPLATTNPMASASASATQTTSFEPEPIATTIAEPIAAPIRRPVLLDRPVAPARKIPVTPRVQPKPPHEASSSGKWLGIVAVLAVGAAGGWFYFTHHRQTAAPQAATEVASTPATSELQPTREAVKSATAAASVPAPLKAAATAISVPHAATAISTAAEHSSSPPAKHEEVVAAAPSEPDPIVLSANAPKSPKPVDLDTVVPVKLPSTIAVQGSPNTIALPAVSSSAPKLTAELSTVRTPATLLKRVDPVYPAMAKTARMQGIVELLIKIGKDGSVIQVKKLTGQPILAAAAADAVKLWRYDPAKINGQPTETETTVKLTFDLYH